MTNDLSEELILFENQLHAFALMYVENKSKKEFWDQRFGRIKFFTERMKILLDDTKKELALDET